jgi:type I restriction enzyme, S subunit
MMEDDAVPNIDVNPNDWVEIHRILRTCVPEYEVWAFGSRAKWTAKPYSDLDLAILTDKPLSLQQAAELRSALDESTIPIKVDFVDWAATSESFRKIIEADKVVVLRSATGLSGWTFKRLIDCTVDGALSYGIVQPGQHDESGVPIVRVNNISTGQVHVEEPLRVAPEIEANYQRTRLQGGEVLLTVVGTTGQSAIVPRELAGWNVARAVAVIRPKPEIGARWIHICLQSKTVQRFLDERANTTVQKTLNLGDIKEVPIPIPPPGIKEVIESFAVSLDDKIDLNRRMNTTLEAMTRALFQSWFVDFDPIRAKLDGRLLADLDPATAALFPERLQDSPNGHIPTGWEVKTIESLCDVVTSGGTPARMNKAYWEPATVPWFKTGELQDGPLIDAEEMISEEGLANSSCKLWPAGTILVALYASPTVGRFGVLTKAGTANQAAAALIAKPTYGVPFLMGLLYEARAELQRVAVGAAQQNINQGVLKNHVVIAPPPVLAKAFSVMVAPWFEQRIKLAEQSCTLATLRNTLLPKLLSGELGTQGDGN